MKIATALAGQCVRSGYVLAILVVLAMAPLCALAAPYADYVIDARSGQVLHQTNADTRLHPASLTKMMTLYIAFEAIERGEISLDSKVTISKNAAAEPPSKLGLRAGQTIALRYLIRAAAIKSANDAATAIGEAIEGSEAAFARRMNRTAKALGMTRTTFANANGLTAKGHLSTAHDMAILGRRVFYDYPQYYHIFSRRTADAGIAQVNSTNRRFLDSYEGADGIKTGYTNPAGFNLVASAQRGDKRIIAAVFGGTSTAQRNARMVELLDLGFGKAPRRAAVQKPPAPVYATEPAASDLLANADDGSDAGGVGKTLRLVGAVTKSPRPQRRSTAVPAAVADAVAVAVADAGLAAKAAPEPPADEDAQLLAMMAGIASAVAEAQGGAAVAEAAPAAETAAVADAAPVGPVFDARTTPQPETLALATPEAPAATPEAPAASPLPAPAPGSDPAAAALVAAAPVAAAPVADVAAEAVANAAGTTAPEARPETAAEAVAALAPVPPPAAPAMPGRAMAAPRPRPDEIILSEPVIAAAETAPAEVITRVSTSGGREWGVNVGSFPSRYHAERALLKTALVEMNTLDEALLKVVSRKGAFDANFVGITRETAELACLRLQARQMDCTPIGP